MMRKNIRWFGSYRGFDYEVQNFGFAEGEMDKWCGYVYFKRDNTQPAEYEALINMPINMPVGKYCLDYSSTWLSQLEWHYGITYCSIERTHKQEPYAVKAGCDYQHYWDEGYEYNELDVERDLHRTIDSYYELIEANHDK